MIKGPLTEVEYLNGEMVRLGKKHDIPVPLNSLMVRVVNQMVYEKLMPDTYTVSQLRAMVAESETA